MSGLMSPTELANEARARNDSKLTDDNAYIVEHVIPPLMDRINKCLVCVISEGQDDYVISLYKELRKISSDISIPLFMNESQEMFLIHHLRDTFKGRDDVHVSFRIRKPQVVDHKLTTDPTSNFDIIVSLTKPDTDICVYYDGQCPTRVTDFRECHTESNCGMCPYVAGMPPVPPTPPTPPPSRVIKDGSDKPEKINVQEQCWNNMVTASREDKSVHRPCLDMISNIYGRKRKSKCK